MKGNTINSLKLRMELEVFNDQKLSLLLPYA